jgi:hypothetical protein
MKKKTTQTLLLVVITLLLLVSVTVSAQGQPAQDRRRGNAVSFTGTWNAITAKGKKIGITLRHDRSDYNAVTGNYSPIDGLTTASYQPSDGSIYEIVKVSASTAQPVMQTLGFISGTVKDGVLRFTWREDGGQGAGRFTLSSDGESFEGTFSKTSNPDDTSGGTLNGTRVHSFAGAWRGKLGEGGFELILQQAGSQVTGQLNINSVIFVVKEGRIADNTLRFTIARPGRPMFGGAMSPDEVMGTGELVMGAGGKGFTGKILNADASGTLLAR